MANRFLCGFDDYDTTGMAYEWAMGDAPTVVTGLTGSCVRLKGATTLGTADDIYTAVTPEGIASGFVGFRVMITGGLAAGPFFGLGNGAYTHLTIGINASGNIVVSRSAASAPTFTTGTQLGSAGTVTLLPGVPHYIELEFTINDTTGVAKVYVDGSPTADVSVTGADTLNTAGATVTWIGFVGGIGGNSAYSVYIDDVYVNDTTGSKNTGLEGDVQVRSHMPNANGNSSQWDRSTGADQYATIDDNPPSTTDYNSTSVLNEVDTVNIASLADAGATIKAVQVNILAKKTTSGTAAIVPVMRVDSVDYPHATNLYVPTEWMYLRQNYDQQADSTDWNETDFNATEVGYKKTA